MNYIERMYCSYAYNYNLDHDAAIDPEPWFKTDEEKKMEEAQDHMKEVLYWLYKAEKFDELLFERALEEACHSLKVEFPDDLLKRKVR